MIHKRLVFTTLVCTLLTGAVCNSVLASTPNDGSDSLRQSVTQHDPIDRPAEVDTSAGPDPQEPNLQEPASAQPRISATLVVTPAPPSLSDQLEAEQARARELMFRLELAIQKAKTLELQREILAVEPELVQAPDRRQVQVFFATDRTPTGRTKPVEYFGNQPARQLTFGTCDVVVPRDHRMGYLERPFTIAKIPLSREKENTHVVITEIATLEGVEFFKQVSVRGKKGRHHEAFVFIHGFNVSFAEAARRTAQIAYDLAFDGAPILYSWPSHGVARHYAADEDAVEDTVPRLETFLKRLAIEAGIENVYLIAHSMGSRALAKALERIYLRSNGNPSVRYRHVMMTAPDIRSSTMQDLAPAVKALATRVTIYSSDNDKALKLSRQINNYPRAGQAGDHILLLDGIDTIDVSAVDTDFVGHFYYSSNRSVLADIFQAIRCGEHPDDRFSLERRTQDGKDYWVFVP